MSSAAAPSLKKRILSPFDPWGLLSWAISEFFKVVYETAIVNRNPLGLLHLYKLRDESFSRFWLAMTSEELPADITKLEGSAALIPPLLQQARGDVLDIGPGSGAQLLYLPKPKKSAVNKIYGAEPSVGLHKQLRQRADKHGLGQDYVILACPAEEAALAIALAGAGIIDEPTNKHGLFDTIICVRVLCSIPEPAKAAENFYRLLKPGGSLLVVEHVVNPWLTPKGSAWARFMQAVFMHIGRWRFFVGECCMDRDSESMLRSVAAKDGGWASVELDRHFGWAALPYISGRLTKRA